MDVDDMIAVLVPCSRKSARIPTQLAIHLLVDILIEEAIKQHEDVEKAVEKRLRKSKPARVVNLSRMT